MIVNTKRIRSCSKFPCVLSWLMGPISPFFPYPGKVVRGLNQWKLQAFSIELNFLLQISVKHIRQKQKFKFLVNSNGHVHGVGVQSKNSKILKQNLFQNCCISKKYSFYFKLQYAIAKLHFMQLFNTKNYLLKRLRRATTLLQEINAP